MPELLILFNKACPQERFFYRSLTLGFYQSLTNLAKRNAQLQPTPDILSHLRVRVGGWRVWHLRNTCEAHSPEAWAHYKTET